MDATYFYSNGDDTPVNLAERFGGKYRVTYEESYHAQYGAQARIDDPWLQVIIGRWGHIFPLGGGMLGVSTNSCGPTANRLKMLSFCTILLDGDDGLTLAFHIEHLHEIAKIIRARTTRRLSESRRAALIAAGKATHFKKKSNGGPARDNGAGGQADVAKS